MINHLDVVRGFDNLTDIKRVDRLYLCRACSWWGHHDEAIGAGVFGVRCPDCAGELRIFCVGPRKRDTASNKVQKQVMDAADAKRVRRGQKRLKGWNGPTV